MVWRRADDGQMARGQDPAARRAGGRRNVADAVLLERSGPVASLVLNRPDKHNALRFADLDRLVGLLHEAEEDDDVRVIVLRGRGPSFCSGHDYDDPARSARDRAAPASARGWPWTAASA